MRALFLALLVLAIDPLRTTAGDGATNSLSPLEAAGKKGVTVQISANGSTNLSVTYAPDPEEPLPLRVPAGTIFSGVDWPARVITLRETMIPAGENAVASIPCAGLSLANSRETQPFKATADSEPRLAPVLKALASEDNLPRETSQLAILAVCEDVDFAKWVQSGAAPPRETVAPVATLAEIKTAIDALGILRAVFPERRFALESSNDLKLRALRDPATRPKAMQIFGMTTPPDLAPVAGVAPSIGQLLHTKAGDNCPVCRMRQGPPSRGTEP